MIITVETLSLPTLSRIIGKKTRLDFPGGTVKDLVDLLIQQHGKKVSEMLLDSKGELDLVIQVMINDAGFVPREEINTRPLQDNDQVKFLLLVGGG